MTPQHFEVPAGGGPGVGGVIEAVTQAGAVVGIYFFMN